MQFIRLTSWTPLLGYFARRILLCLLATNWQQRHYVTRLSVWRCPSVNIHLAWRAISLLSREISVKLATNNHHMSGTCWKRFSRSKVRGQGHITSLVCVHRCEQRRRHTFWRCSVEVGLIIIYAADIRQGMSEGLKPSRLNFLTPDL